MKQQTIDTLDLILGSRYPRGNRYSISWEPNENYHVVAESMEHGRTDVARVFIPWHGPWSDESGLVEPVPPVPPGAKLGRVAGTERRYLPSLARDRWTAAVRVYSPQDLKRLVALIQSEATLAAEAPFDNRVCFDEDLDTGMTSVQTKTRRAPNATISPRPRFGYERDLQRFMHENWDSTPFATDWMLVGVEYPARDAGRIDMLARSPDSAKWLVVELKRNKAPKDVIDQTRRYMGWVSDNLAERGATVEGVIVATHADPHLEEAVSASPSLRLVFYALNVQFTEAEGVAEPSEDE